MLDIPRASAHRLKLDNPQIVNRYLDILDRYLAAHKVYLGIQNLILTYNVGSPLTPAQVKEYEDLDRIRVDGMLYVEKRCCKLQMGKVQWSPALQQAQDMIAFWTLICKQLKKCKVGAQRIVQLKKKLQIKGNMHLLIEEVDAKLSKARERYKVCKHNDKVLRRDFLESLVEAKSAEGNTKASTILNNLIHWEEIWSIFRQIQRVTKKRQNGTIKIHVEKTGPSKKS